GPPVLQRACSGSDPGGSSSTGPPAAIPPSRTISNWPVDSLIRGRIDSRHLASRSSRSFTQISSVKRALAFPFVRLFAESIEVEGERRSRRFICGDRGTQSAPAAKVNQPHLRATL